MNLDRLQEELQTILAKSDWDDINIVTQNNADRIYKLTTDNHIKKFNKLLPSTNSTTTKPVETSKVIINLTDDIIDEPTTSLLMKGLNYAVVPKRIPTEEIICGIETAVKNLPLSQAEEIRQDISVILRKSKPPKPNLNKEEIAALRKLKQDTSKIILPADKGNATVIMKTDDYKCKIRQMIEEGPYKKVRNPTKRIAANISKLVKSSNIDFNMKKSLTNSDPKPPLLYGLPKIHKENIPMRPIVSSIGSPTYYVAKFLSNLITEDVGKTDSFVKDSRHFISLLKDLKLDDNDILVSFDVESLFTQVPIQETIEIIQDLLDPELAELARLCLKSTYFYFDGQFYEQTEGAAMGSPLSPVAANLYMETFEKQALETAPLKPKKWLRYVDDVWVIWPHGLEKLDLFLKHLNSVHPNIKFTMEIEKERQLPFLDVITRRKIDGTIGHSVYRKPTHTNRYLNANSNHHPAQKNGLLNTLINRAIHISDKENWNNEKQTIQTTLQLNGYSKYQINKALNKQLTRTATTQNVINLQQESDDQFHKAFLPFIKGTTDKIERILKKHKIKTIFRPTTKIINFLRPVKDTIPLNMPGVYQVPCSCGSVYIGETKRLVSTRLKEHIRSTKNREIEKSAIAEHSETTQHGILFDETKVLANIPHYYTRKIRETIEIIKHKNNFNKEDSFQLSKSWQPVLQKLQ